MSEKVVISPFSSDTMVAGDTESALSEIAGISSSEEVSGAVIRPVSCKYCCDLGDNPRQNHA